VSSSIDWHDVIKKEARGINDADFGEVQEVTPQFVITQKGLIDIEIFGIPKGKAESYDGSILRFNVSEDEAYTKYRGPENFEKGSQGEDDLTKDKVQIPSQYIQDNQMDKSTTVPLMEERIDVSKRTEENKVTITKEPVTETKTIEIPVTHEEISIETRKSQNGQSETDQKPVTSTQEIEIPVKREKVEIIKRPYVKEEVVVKKNPVTETKGFTEEITSERIDLED
jgi:uncharacterized protein (TIGR02271 family)